MQTTIEIDGSLIRDDYEIIAFRQVLPGELIMNRWGSVSPYGGENKSDDYCIIVRPIWQWPDWIKPGTWLAQHRTGSWWLFDHEPASLMGHDDWNRDGWVIPSRCVDFTPPPCTDWRESKRQKPEE